MIGYRLDPEFVPANVKRFAEALQREIEVHTDWAGVQVTFEGGTITYDIRAE